MPLFFSPLVALALGLLLSLPGRGARGAEGATQARRAVWMFAWLAMFPACLLVALEFPAWATLHKVGGGLAPGATVAFSGASALLVFAGHELGERVGGVTSAGVLAGGALAAVVVASVALRHRLGVVEATESGAEVPWSSTGFLAVVSALDALLAAAFALTWGAIDDAVGRTTSPGPRRRRPRGSKRTSGAF